MSDDIELLRRAVDAFNRGDLDTLRDFYAPDVTADAGELWPAAGRVHGVDRVLAEFAAIFATFEQVELICEDYIERGGAVVIPTRWRGRLSGSDHVIEQVVFPVYRLRDGHLVSIDYLGTLDAALAAADTGLPPAGAPGEREPRGGQRPGRG